MVESDCERLIQSLYTALVQPAGFKPFLKQFVQRCNLLSAAIVVFNESLERENIIWMEGLDISDASLFLQQNSKKDPLIMRLSEALPGELITMGDCDAELMLQVNPDFFQRLNRDLDIYYAGGSVLSYESESSCQFFFHRSKNQGEFSLQENRFIERIIPHIQHSMQLYQLKLKYDQPHLIRKLLFNQIQLPVILLDEQGYVADCNQQAEQFLSSHNYLKKVNQTLHWINVKINQRIQRAIQRCLQQNSICNIQLSGDDAIPTTLTFAPLFHKQGRHAGVALFIYHRHLPCVNRELLSQLYNLSTKESLICSELVNGHSLLEVAKIANLSYETVRSYLKTIMKKTATKRQSELVVKVMTSPACNIMHKEQLVI
ncbi:helix-turn-helix transcriptional regulator [Psychromonas sp. MME2]|uniref:helix-turn-helix transcriptional regulator n=1 Tax=unclassified Psychromonas TaxID=2614957 RepID=UPI00339CAACD